MISAGIPLGGWGTPMAAAINTGVGWAGYSGATCAGATVKRTESRADTGADTSSGCCKGMAASTGTGTLNGFGSTYLIIGDSLASAMARG